MAARHSLLLASISALALCGCPANTSVADAGGGTDSGSRGGDSGIVSDSGTQQDAGGGMDAGTGDGGYDQNFPTTSIIYWDVSDAGTDPNSLAIINALATAGGWGNGNVFQIDFSMVILHADDTVVPRAFTPNAGYATPDCDMTPVPLPPGGAVEGYPNYQCGGGDCHLMVYQGTRLYEMWVASTADGTATGSPFTANCEVVWDLTRDYWVSGANPYSRGDQCTSADAAGMPIAPLIVTGAELQAGAVNHALRFILPNGEIGAGSYLHPGTHMGGPTGAAPLPLYTSRFRLRSDFPASTYTPAAQVVIAALKKYGMFLDDGGNIALTFEQSASAYLGSHDLQGIQVTDFQVVASPDPAVAWTGVCSRTVLTQ